MGQASLDDGGSMYQSEYESLQRFLSKHNERFELALSEIKAGRKQSHWMWFIYPQIKGLGRSRTAQKYAISDLAEASAFLRHPTLGQNYCAMVEASWTALVQNKVDVVSMFGRVDARKLLSSLTLFEWVAVHIEFKSVPLPLSQMCAEIFEVHERHKRCPYTLRFIAESRD